MKTTHILSVSAAALALMAGAAFTPAQAATAKPIVQVTCEDYMAMNETLKPKFIYYAQGLSKKGDPEAVLDIEGTDKIQPALDEACRVHLTDSAFQQMLKLSEASEKTNR